MPDIVLKAKLATEDTIKVGVVVVLPQFFTVFLILVEVDGHLPDAFVFSTETIIISSPLLLLERCEFFVTDRFHF